MHKVLKATRMSIRDFAVLIGKMVASAPGVEFAPMYCRGLEKEKTRQLRLNKGDFDASLILTDDNKSDIQWWLDNLETSYKAKRKICRVSGYMSKIFRVGR